MVLPRSKCRSAISLLVLSRCCSQSLGIGGNYFDELQTYRDRFSLQSTFCVPTESLSWLALGDWGQPGDAQQQVAATMAREASKRQPDFLLLLGDNFYPAGVFSSHDPQWNTTYDAVYDEASLQVSHYAVLGNHDYYSGNPFAQIERCRNADSKNWRMPDRWYSREFVFDTSAHCSDHTPGVKVLFLFLDTMVLAVADLGLFENGTRGKRYWVEAEQRSQHWKWLEETLKASTADWVFVVGHHPVFSAGKHGDQATLKQKLDPLLVKYGVDMYLSGHDHDQQMLLGDHGLTYLISGSGSKLRNTSVPHDRLAFQRHEYGFASSVLNRTHLVTTWLSESGQLLHRHVQTPRGRPPLLSEDTSGAELTRGEPSVDEKWQAGNGYVGASTGGEIATGMDEMHTKGLLAWALCTAIVLALLGCRSVILTGPEAHDPVSERRLQELSRWG